ncbi:UDP-N-acetylmuramoyl-L-alanine--D-glutamate ligase [Desulfogranum japonicum]|uniref:UDP-N-acetylmuramoyl-L-alanine--D-glutamate ligase n=1 Tax=Desulfogranum japonicum TaxID=231447 RepID=UPI0004101EE5|nr:UDP-N-acetylmuramoyl-L-alanine--D-glutamate ligase [Desulfogranum japonicum]
MRLSPADTAVVLGCGKSGLSVIRFLRKYGVRVFVSETREEADLPQDVLSLLHDHVEEYECGGHRSDFVCRADFVVPSPGIPLDSKIIEQAKASGLQIVGELGLAAGRFHVPVIGVTGSNGKTTVTSLIGHLLEQGGKRVFVGGNIGTPLLDFFAEPSAYDGVVLELSSFQLELVGSFRPDIAVVLNISPDHLDRHHSMAAYALAKKNLLSHQIAGDIAVLGGDDPVLSSWSVNPDVKKIFFGQTEGAEAQVRGDEVLLSVDTGGGMESYPLAQGALSSLVNRLNAAAAILVASCSGLENKLICQGLEGFNTPPHRMSEVAVIDGVQYINDSKATNIGAMEAALKSCLQPVVLIAGGRDKQSDFTLLASLIQQKVKHLFLIGEAAPVMQQAFSSVVSISMVSSLCDAVKGAKELAVAGDVVLLAPGCASFDMFSGYAERGKVFSDCVMQLNKLCQEKQ